MADFVLDMFTLFGPVPPRGGETGTARLQALLERHNITGAVTLSTRGLYHSAAAGNRETIALCAEAGPKLAPAVVLDPRQPGAERTIAGGRVLCLLPDTQQWPALYAPAADLLRTLAALGGAATANIPVWWESARPGDATVIAQMLKETNYPAPVVLGGVPGDCLYEAMVAAKGNERLHIATNGLQGVGEVKTAVDGIGANRVVFGSGAPARSLGSALALIRNAGLSPETEAAVLGGNARRLLGGTAQ